MRAMFHKFGQQDWQKNKYVQTNFKATDDVITVRSRDFGKKLYVFQKQLCSTNISIKIANENQSWTNLNDADKVITVRLSDLEKTYAHVNKNCYHQTWAAGRLRGIISGQTNLNGTDDVMIQRSLVFAKS